MKTFYLGNYEFFLGKHKEPCAMCRDLTQMTIVDFQIPICSIECADAKWDELAEQSREMSTEEIVGSGL